MGDSSYADAVMYPVCIPFSSLMAMISMINLSLMWAQVASNSRTMKKGGANLGKNML